MMASSSSSRMLAAAALVTLFVGAWCAASVEFTVEKGSDEKKLALKIKEYNKDGDSLAEVELKEHGTNEWQALKKNYDGVWEIKSDKALKGPFNFRFQSEKGMRNVFDDVVPAEFKVGNTYKPSEY